MFMVIPFEGESSFQYYQHGVAHGVYPKLQMHILAVLFHDMFGAIVIPLTRQLSRWNNSIHLPNNIFYLNNHSLIEE